MTMWQEESYRLLISPSKWGLQTNRFYTAEEGRDQLCDTFRHAHYEKCKALLL